MTVTNAYYILGLIAYNSPKSRQRINSCFNIVFKKNCAHHQHQHPLHTWLSPLQFVLQQHPENTHIFNGSYSFMLSRLCSLSTILKCLSLSSALAMPTCYSGLFLKKKPSYILYFSYWFLLWIRFPALSCVKQSLVICLFYHAIHPTREGSMPCPYGKPPKRIPGPLMVRTKLKSQRLKFSTSWNDSHEVKEV